MRFWGLHANSRSLDCEDRPLRRRSSSLGMTELRRSRLELLHHLHKIFEEVMRIVWAGTGFRVVLNAEQWQIAMAHAFERRVVQVHMRKLDFGLRQRIRIDGEVVIMSR